MATSVRRVASQCGTSSKVVLSGFSQGAQVVHKAAKQLETSYHKYVGAIVLFGDPNNGEFTYGSMRQFKYNKADEYR